MQGSSPHLQVLRRDALVAGRAAGLGGADEQPKLVPLGAAAAKLRDPPGVYTALLDGAVDVDAAIALAEVAGVGR